MHLGLMNSTALVTGAGKANFTRSSASEIWSDTPPPADSAYIIPLWLTGTVSANGWVEPAGPEICVHIGGVEPTWLHPLLEKECRVRPIQASFQRTLPRRYACVNSRPRPHCSALFSITHRRFFLSEIWPSWLKLLIGIRKRTIHGLAPWMQCFINTLADVITFSAFRLYVSIHYNSMCTPIGSSPWPWHCWCNALPFELKEKRWSWMSNALSRSLKPVSFISALFICPPSHWHSTHP